MCQLIDCCVILILVYLQPTLLYIVCPLKHMYTDRIAESGEPSTVDYTGQIRQFSEIGPGGVGTTPGPWVCYVQNTSSGVQWQMPNGSVVLTVPSGFIANGTELYQTTNSSGAALIRGPDYNSPDGEYCCVIPMVSGQRKCVTLSECALE